MDSQSVLREELAHYQALRSSLLASSEGKFALIIGQTLIGVYETHSEAYRAGLAGYGNIAMLIRRVQRYEPVTVLVQRPSGLIHGDFY